MKLENAIKKLSKYTTVENSGQFYRGQIGNMVVTFTAMSDNAYEAGNNTRTRADMFWTKRASEKWQSEIDYFPGMRHDNLKQAIDHALEHQNQ